ncbi:hypothetical protein Rcae01_01219 [Novipirellula caenicola]|uniref:Uncharacterized protein n=1 Tax=Novipirellula caenicola TaxID=1536901 RepID=A0ABP9VKT4_9BACT
MVMNFWGPSRKKGKYFRGGFALCRGSTGRGRPYRPMTILPHSF